MPAKKKHEAEIWSDKQISRAVAFTASVFYNGRSNTLQFHTCEAAQAMAARMTEAAANGRRGVVYAIMPEGNAVYVSSH